MRNRLTEIIVGHMLPGQRAMMDTLLQLDAETVTAAGACSLDIETTQLAVSGTKAYTLAAPTIAGQRKRIVCLSAASTPAGTLTITSPDDTTGSVCATTFFFDTVGQAVELEATVALKWRARRVQRAGLKTLTVGTTVTTGICNLSHVALAVTGTVSSTTTKALPDGSAVGEICFVGCSTAAGTPHGTLGGTFLLTNGAAGTTLVDFTAITNQAALYWTGTAWQVFGAVGGIVAA